MDKAILGFFADVLYLKGIICFEEFEAVMEAKDSSDLGVIFEKMIRGEFNVYKRGEAYSDSGKSGIESA